MKKIISILSIVLFASFSYSQNKGNSVKLTVFFEPMNPYGWQYFFFADSLKKKIPSVEIDINPFIKKMDNNWYSKNGNAEIDEAARMTAVKEKYPDKFYLYVVGRSLSPWSDGWKDACILASINPKELFDYLSKNKDTLLEKAYARVLENKIESSAIFINGERYEGDLRLSKFIEKIDSYLKDKKINLYKNELANFKTPKFYIAVSSSTKNWVSKDMISVFKRFLSDLNPEIIDINEQPSKFANLKFLPAYILEKDNSVKEAFSQPINAGIFEDNGNYYVFYNKDSNLYINGYKEEPHNLELYVMSQCPFGVMAENAVISAYKQGLIDKKVKISIYYIADEVKSPDGKLAFNSLHGEEEWKEDARQVYIADKYPDKFFNYILERNKNYRETNWQQAAEKAGLNPQEIEKNFELAKKMLSENIKKGNSLGITTSPSFIVDKAYLIVGLSELKKMDDYKNINVSNPTSQGCSQ